MSFKSLFLACATMLGATLLPLSATAQSTAKTQDLLCTFKVDGQRGWLPPEVIVIDVPSKPSVVVFDGLIMQVNDGKPLEAQISRVRGDTVTFSWGVSTRAASGTPIRARYSATLNRATRAATIEVRVGNRGQRQFARGTCTPRAS